MSIKKTNNPVTGPVLKKSMRAAASKIYVPKSLRTHLPTQPTKSGTKLAKNNTGSNQ